MKNILLFLVLVSVVPSINAQELVTNEVNRFTKASEKLTSYGVLKMGFSKVLKVRAKSVNDSKALRFLYSRLGGSFIIPMDASIYLLLENDQTVELKAMSTVLSTVEGSCYAEAVYDLPNEDAERLLSAPLVAVRIDMTDTYVELDIPQKNKHVLQDVVTLLQ